MNNRSIALSIDVMIDVEDDTLAFMLQLYLERLHEHNYPPVVAEVIELLREQQPMSVETCQTMLKAIDGAINATDLVEYLWTTPNRVSIHCTVYRHNVRVHLNEGRICNDLSRQDNNTSQLHGDHPSRRRA